MRYERFQADYALIGEMFGGRNKVMLSYNMDISEDSKWIIVTENDIAHSMPFYITEIGEFYARSNYYTERSGRSGYYLMYTVSGEGEILIDEQYIRLTPNRVLIIKCDNIHRYATSADHWDFMWIHMDGEGVSSYESLINDNRYLTVDMKGNREVQDIITRLLSFSSRSDVISYARMSDELSSLLTLILTQKLISKLKGETNRVITHYKDIKSVINYIENNYKNQINIDDMINKVNISKYHFIRLFKQQMGTTPYDYLVHFRINKAKFLLRNTINSVSQIAKEVGYFSESNFIGQFKSVVGMTPNKYRKESVRYLDG